MMKTHPRLCRLADFLAGWIVLLIAVTSSQAQPIVRPASGPMVFGPKMVGDFVISDSSACDSATATLGFFNTNIGSTLHLGSISALGFGISLGDTVDLPPGETLTIPIVIPALNADTTLDTLRLAYDNIDTFYEIRIIRVPGAELYVSVAPGRDSSHESELLDIPVVVSAVGGRSVAGPLIFRMSIGLNTDLLSPVKVMPSVAGVTLGNLDVKPEEVIVPVTVASGISFSVSTELFKLTVQAMVTDTLATSAVMTGAQFVDNPPGCQSISAHFIPFIFHLIPKCTDVLISNAMAGPPFEITSVSPNPAGRWLHVGLRSPVDAETEYEVIDQLGRVVERGYAVGETLDLSLSDLAEGVYSLRLTSNGQVSTRRFVRRM